MVDSRCRFVLATLSLCLPLALGCGSDGSRTFGGDGTGGASTGTGGASNGAGGATGSGGATSGSGGVTGSGGVIGNGGVTGNGGRGTGGRIGSGGVSATGGVRGTGGAGGITASGGTTGSGGTSSGGAGGATMTCDQIAAEYAAEMPIAKTCSLASTVAQCQTAVPAGLGCAGNCITYVQNATHLNEIQAKWNARGCPATIQVCPAVLCLLSQPGICALTTGASTPQCQNTPPAMTSD